MRKLKILVVLAICMSLSSWRTTQAAGGCGVSEQNSTPSACRDFQYTDSNNHVLGEFQSYALASVPEADLAFKIISDFRNSPDFEPANTTYNFGDHQASFIYKSSSVPSALVAFEIKQQVGAWAIIGTNIGDPFNFLHDLFMKLQLKVFSDDASGRVMSLLPSLDDLPAGYTLAEEHFASGITPVAPIGTKTASNSGPDFQATISVLQTQVSQTSTGATTLPTPTPIPPSPQTVLSVVGSGINTTQTFSVLGDWDLSWSYDCTSFFGGSGNFQVYVYDSNGTISFTNAPVNQLGTSGAGVEHYHSAGSYYLVVNSECSWTISAVG